MTHHANIQARELVAHAHHLSLWSAERWILENVSFDLFQGAFCVLLGCNGAGKSSLLRVLAGVLPPSWRVVGRCEILSEVPCNSGEMLSRGVSWLGQHQHVSEDMTVQEYLSLSGRSVLLPYDDEFSARCRADFAVGSLLGHRLSALSGGQWQRVRLAQALSSRAKLILLDEPDAALDERWRRVLWRVLLERRQAGAAVVVALHRHLEVQGFVSNWIGLEEGRLVFSEDRPGVYPRAFVERLFLEKSLTRPNG